MKKLILALTLCFALSCSSDDSKEDTTPTTENPCTDCPEITSIRVTDTQLNGVTYYIQTLTLTDCQAKNTSQTVWKKIEDIHKVGEKFCPLNDPCCPIIARVDDTTNSSGTPITKLLLLNACTYSATYVELPHSVLVEYQAKVGDSYCP